MSDPRKKELDILVDLVENRRWNVSYMEYEDDEYTDGEWDSQEFRTKKEAIDYARSAKIAYSGEFDVTILADGEIVR